MNNNFSVSSLGIGLLTTIFTVSSAQGSNLDSDVNLLVNSDNKIVTVNEYSPQHGSLSTDTVEVIPAAELRGNSWGSVKLVAPYEVTPDTAITFEMCIEDNDAGEFTGIYPIIGEPRVAAHFARMNGRQANNGLSGEGLYDMSGEVCQDISVKLSDYVPDGSIVSDVLFARDDDLRPLHYGISKAAIFKDVKIGELDPLTGEYSSNPIDILKDTAGNLAEIVSHANNGSNGTDRMKVTAGFQLRGNAWGEFATPPYEVTNSTTITYSVCPDSDGDPKFGEFSGVYVITEGGERQTEHLARLNGRHENNGASGEGMYDIIEGGCQDISFKPIDYGADVGSTLVKIVVAHDDDMARYYTDRANASITLTDLHVGETSYVYPNGDVLDVRHLYVYSGPLDNEMPSLIIGGSRAAIGDGNFTGYTSVHDCSSDQFVTQMDKTTGECIVTPNPEISFDHVLIGKVGYRTVNSDGEVSQPNEATVYLTEAHHMEGEFSRTPFGLSDACGVVTYSAPTVSLDKFLADGGLEDLASSRINGEAGIWPEGTQRKFYNMGELNFIDGSASVRVSDLVGTRDNSISVVMGAVRPDSNGDCTGYASSGELYTEVLDSRVYTHKGDHKGAGNLVGGYKDVSKPVIDHVLLNHPAAYVSAIMEFSDIGEISRCVSETPSLFADDDDNGIPDVLDCMYN